VRSRRERVDGTVGRAEREARERRGERGEGKRKRCERLSFLAAHAHTRRCWSVAISSGWLSLKLAAELRPSLLGAARGRKSFGKSREAQGFGWLFTGLELGDCRSCCHEL